MRVVSHMSRKYAGPANHNSRSDFKVMSSNIDFTKSKDNWYWNVFTGDADQNISFKKVEEEYYAQNYTAWLDAQNARNIKQRHRNRCKTMDQVMNGRFTKPHEQILQFGDKDDYPTREELLDILKDYFKWYTENFPQAVILDMALHMDEEGAPHIHIRRVFEVTGEDGKQLLQGQALREMGLKRPNPNLPNGQFNNELMTFTAMNRDKAQEIAIAHGLDIEVADITDKKPKTKHLQPAEYKLKKINEEIERKTEMNKQLQSQNKQLQSQNKKYEQDLQHSKSELEHLNDRLSVVNEDITKAKSEFQILKNQLDVTREAVKEVERTKGTVTKELDTQRELLNQGKEAVRAIENFVYGYDSDSKKAITLIERFCSNYKKKNGIDLLSQYNSFVEGEKKATEDIERMLRNLPDFDTPQTDDGYDY